jgi:hypothetical protein
MTCNPSGDVGCNPSGHGDTTLLVGIFHLTTIVDPHQDLHQEEAHTIFINNIIMSTNDLLIKDIIARSALGFYCQECSRSLQDDSVRTHLQRQHKHVFDSTPPVAYQNHLKEPRLSTANASVDDTRSLPRVFTSGAICPLSIYIRSLFISVNLHQEPFAH